MIAIVAGRRPIEGSEDANPCPSAPEPFSELRQMYRDWAGADLCTHALASVNLCLSEKSTDKF